MDKNFLIVLKNLQSIKKKSKKAFQKTAEATVDLIGHKIADKITSVSKKPAMELHFKELTNNDEDVEIDTHKKRYISAEERQQIIDELMLTFKRQIYNSLKRNVTN